MSNMDIEVVGSERRFEAMKSFTAALAAAQAEIDTASKNKKNAFFSGSKYADLASVWEAWQEVGPKNGFAVIQMPKDAGDRQGIILKTILLHKDGGSMSSVSFFPSAKNDSQAYGSAITYARRYMLAAMVGIAPDDDDGNAASGRGTRSEQVPPKSLDASIVVGAFRKKLDEAYGKYRDDSTRLGLLLKEAEKVSYNELADTISGRIKELANTKPS